MSKENHLSSFLNALEKKPKNSRSFSIRSTQKTMMESIWTAFEEARFSVIEAPTGTGKSLGYLIPSLLKLQEEGAKLALSESDENIGLEPIVVSTATLTLQNQLLEKDIPTALKLIKAPNLKAFVLKGRANYLCRSRLGEYLRRNPDLTDNQEAQLDLIQEWATSTKLGDKAELSFNPDAELWSNICGDPTICAGLRCAVNEQCFFYHNKKEASSSALIIVNHKLLAHDLAIKSQIGMQNEQNAILPHTTRLIIDEAHKFPADLEDAYAVGLSYPLLNKTLSRIDPSKKGNVLSMGLLVNPKSVEKVRECLKEVKSTWQEAEAYLLNYWDNIPIEDSFLARAPFKLFNHSLWTSDAYKNYLDMSANTRSALKDLLTELEKIRQPLKDEKGRESDLAEMNGFILEIGGFLKSWNYFFEQNVDAEIPYARWVEKKFRTGAPAFLSFNLYPLEIGGLLAHKVYPHLRTLVLTSATLSVQGNFQNFLGSLGLSGEATRARVTTQTLESVFDPSRVLFTTTIDFPAPEAGNAYLSHILPAIEHLINVNGRGGTLILATSYDMVQKIHLHLKEVGLDMPIYSQGSGADNNQILANFKKKTHSVLIGTDSFWEGVDVPGDSLSLVIIPKLPFAHPQDPVHYTKKQYLTQVKKMNSFVSYDVPNAVLKFKQGFGRLMRQTDDSGVVVCLDSRLHAKPYGRTFIASLAPHEHQARLADQVMDHVESWFKRRKK